MSDDYNNRGSRRFSFVVALSLAAVILIVICAGLVVSP